MNMKKRAGKGNSSTKYTSKDIPGIEAMSNAELINAIESIMTGMTEENLDSALVERYLGLLQERAPVMEKYDSIVELQRLQESHPLLAMVDERKIEPNSAKATYGFKLPARHQRYIRRIAVAVLVVALLSMGIAQAAGFDVFGAIARWTAEIFQFSAESTDSKIVTLNEGEEACYSSLFEALDALKVNETLAPNWLPEGFDSPVVTAKVFSGELVVSAEFTNDDKLLLFRYRKIIDGDYTTIEKEDNISIISQNGIDHYLMANYDINSAVWVNGAWECVISGSISLQDLENMVLSIYK